jgi:ankyrin repeat protein
MSKHKHALLILMISLGLSCVALDSSHLRADDKVRQGERVNEACIRQDLVGKSLSGWTFEEGTLCRIRILDADYQKDRAVLKVSMKAVKHIRTRPGWIGKKGEMELQYENQGKGWSLVHVEANALSNLGPDDIYSLRKTDGRPFLVAVDEGDVDTVKTMIKKGVNYYQRARRGETALMIAAGRGHLDVAQVLVKKGLDVNASSLDGVTALMIAASCGQSNMVKFLLDNGADVNFKGPLGCTALLMALERRPGRHSQSDKALLTTVSTLIDHGAPDLNVRDGRGFTPLWLATKQGEEDVVRILLDKGANVNMRAGETDYTPLMQAVATGCPSLVKVLLEKGADVNAEKNGVTALNIAKSSSFRWKQKLELIELLKAAGATK